MQRCPKCGRTYEDDEQKFCTFDGGRLAIDTGAHSPAPAPYKPADDLGATLIHESFPDLKAQMNPLPPPELYKTVASPSRPTSEFDQTGQTSQTGAASPSQPPAPPVSTPPAPAPAAPSQVLPPARKSKRLLWVVGGVAVFGLLLAGAIAVSLYMLMNRSSDDGISIGADVNFGENSNAGEDPRAKGTDETASASPSPSVDANANVNTEADVSGLTPPPNSARFINSRTGLDDKLAERYVDFSFFYPKSWKLDSKAGKKGSSNFVKVERTLPPDFTQENFAVGWYESDGGTMESDRALFPQLVESLSARFSKSFPEYEKISEGETKVNSLDGYEFRFKSLSKGTEKGDITIWGRVIFLPPGVEGQKNGVTLLMLATSLAPELKSVQDVGVKGELPLILDSFRLSS